MLSYKLAVAESGDSLTSLKGGGERGGYISHNRDDLYDNYNYWLCKNLYWLVYRLQNR